MTTQDLAPVRAQLIERSDGWWALIEEDGTWRLLGGFLSEPEAVEAARARIGETGLIDVLHRDEARARDGIEDIADVAEAGIDHERRAYLAEADAEDALPTSPQPSDIDVSVPHAD